jgi:hypothetical protein
MSHALDNLLVALALAASAGYAALSLGPKGWRLRLYGALAQGIDALPAALRLQGVARRLRAASQRAAGACGGCGDCAPRADSGTGGRETAVPLEQIGRRGR